MEKVESTCPSSKICWENSEWMVENVQGLDQSVKKMLLLIEHEGEFPMEKAHSNDPMQPELIACIKEISRRHHLLVDHYNKLTGDLSNYGKTSFDHLFVTPKKMQNVEGQIVPCELSLSCGGGISDATPNEGSESSLLSSDSDSESYDSSPEKLLKHETEIPETIKGGGSGEYEMLKRRMLDYEKEVKVCEEKLESAEDEIARQKRQLENKEAIIVRISGVEAQLEMHQVEMEEEKKRSVMLQGKIFDLEAKLQELENELLDRDGEIEKLNAEKQQFESSVSMLSERLSFHEARTNELHKQCESFEAEKVEMLKNKETLIASWKDNIEQVKMELRDKNVMVDTLNKNLDKLKLNYTMVIAEKDAFNAKLQTLSGDLSVRDDQIQCIQHNLNQLRSEKGEANKVIAELKSRINELEKDVGMRKVEILEIGEEKREAIRQLCFALDHFRTVYQQRKPPTCLTFFRVFFC
ncbi:hypothetical protein ACS0TY_011037 [Phlomoides rotata]